MATGIGGHSPADLPRYLGGIVFPATRIDLVHHANQHHADPQMIEQLERLPDREYDSMEEVVENYRKQH